MKSHLNWQKSNAKQGSWRETRRKTESLKFIQVCRNESLKFIQVYRDDVLKTDMLFNIFFPAESSRPYLSHIENVENSDYINACYVDVS